jgi:hypothetical protein
MYANVYQGLTEYGYGMASFWILHIPAVQSRIFCEAAIGLAPHSRYFFNDDICVCYYTGVGIGILFPKFDQT